MARKRTYVPLNVILNGRLVGVLTKGTLGRCRIQVRLFLVGLGAHFPGLAVDAVAGRSLYRCSRLCCV